MKKHINIDNLKYMRFAILLILTGICYFFRGEILPAGRAISHSILYYYKDAIEQEEPSWEDLQGYVSSGDMIGKNEQLAEQILPNSPSAEFVQDAGDSYETDTFPWEFVTDDESYFDDAVFIGDSRTVGLQDYAGLTNASFYCSTGLTIYKVFSSPIVDPGDGKKKITIEDALKSQAFGKIYLMIGINEMGTGDVDSFIQKYQEVVDHLQELQPDAVIYLESIMKVSSERSQKGDYINNEGIDARNAEIEKLADQKKIFYLDVNSSVCDDSGALDASFTFDGVHLKASYISLWKQYLLNHIVKICNKK